MPARDQLQLAPQLGQIAARKQVSVSLVQPSMPRRVKLGQLN
jgi:hypothetical protein